MDEWLIIGVILNSLGYIFYGLGVRRQIAGPSRASWLIWSVSMSIEAITYETINQGAIQNIFFLISACCCILTTIAVWNHSSWQRLSVIDTICLVACFVSLILWLVYQNAWWAHLSILITIPISFLPTWSHMRKNPLSDYSPAWGLWTISDLIVVFTVIGSGAEEVKNELPYATIEFLCNGVSWLIIGFISIDPRKTFRVFKSGIGMICISKTNGYVFLIARNKMGKGVYSGQTFVKGQEVIEFQGEIYQRNDLPIAVSNATDRFLQIDHDLFIGPSDDIDDLINHNCNPSAGIKFLADGCVKVVALRDIGYGDELTIDYSTTSLDHDWTFHCLCGSSNCRGIIGDFRSLPEATKQHYRQLNILPSYVLKVMDEDVLIEAEV